MAKGQKNDSLALGIVWKAVPIAQDEGETRTLYVRGLSPADITTIMREDGGEALGLLYTQLTTNAATPDDVLRIATALLHDVPNLAARIIARAADRPDDWELVMDFATGAQMDLLGAIAELTFRSENVVKKLMEIVERYGKERAAQLTPTALRPGSGDSENK